MNHEEIKQVLEDALKLYNHSGFIETDPVSIPHLFTRKEDIEISAFLTATISWGQRKSILVNANRILLMMDNAPFDFIKESNPKDLQKIKNSGFVHRTFDANDLFQFLVALKRIYANYPTLENAFYAEGTDITEKILSFRNKFIVNIKTQNTLKHISDPAKNSACKRLNMFLRWMVRKDESGIDFGIWKTIKPSELLCPLDIHSGNTARELNILSRKANDLKATIELTVNLKKFCEEDPVKYDIALFALGVNGIYSKTRPS